MKKIFNMYVAIWAVLLVVFNAIAFISPGWIGIEKYSPSFWIGYVVITFAFLGQLACAWKAFGTDDLQKFFYSVPLIRISYAGLVATFVFGGLCMFLSLLWGWVAAIVCIVVVAITVLAVIKAGTAGEMVGEIDDKIKAETRFIKVYTVKAAELCDFAESAEVKSAAKKIAEAFRYSDPMSCNELRAAEAKIEFVFEKFENAVKTGSEEVSALSEELEKLIKARNNECRLLK